MRDYFTQQRARELRGHLSDAEQRLWRYLRRKHLHGHRFRRQVPIGPYIVDFACLSAALVVEVDGSQHAKEHVYDEKRDGYLKSQGFRVLRFWSDQALRETEGVLMAILRELDNPRAPIPTFPRKRGKG